MAAKKYSSRTLYDFGETAQKRKRRKAAKNLRELEHRASKGKSVKKANVEHYARARRHVK